MRRLLLYLVLILAACAPTVIAVRAIGPGFTSISPGADAR